MVFQTHVIGCVWKTPFRKSGHILKCNLVSGPVIVGVRPSLPVQGITVLLGNDLAGGRVLQSPQVTVVPQMRCDDVTKQTQELFPACAVTRAMARARSSPIATSKQDNVHTLHNTGDTDLSISDMSLGRAAADVPTSSSDSENPKVNEGEVNNVLSWQELIREQKRDPEILSLSQSL